MDAKKIKAAVAGKVAEKAKKRAYETVGRSIPLGVHEVEVPKELKYLLEDNEVR